MIPSTFVGLLLFLVVLAPGLCFTIAWEARRPKRNVSILYESGTVVLTSLAVVGVAGVLFGLLRTFMPTHVLDIHQLVSKQGATYARGHLAYVLEWGAAILVAACLGAYVLGRLAARWALKRNDDRGIRQVSAWYSVMYEMQRTGFKDCFVHVGCYLDDGTWVGGFLKSFSADLEETPDRELVLLAPIARRDGSGKVEERKISAVILSSRRVIQLDVSFTPEIPAFQEGKKPDDRAEGPSF